MTLQTFDFEKPLLEIEEQIESLNASSEDETPEHAERLEELHKELDSRQREIYSTLTPWQRVLIARHMQRPRALDYIRQICTGWVEIKGDRGFKDDNAVVCGMARLGGRPIAVIGQQKGKDTRENMERNFGMMHPEGYRKALRVMHLAERFSLPLLILIDTPGAYPGIGAEERGQGEAIARNIMEMFTVQTPIVGVVIGEGASGGALGIGVVDHMIMLENSWYCVISPEGCASILLRDAAKAPEIAEKQKLTAQDLLDLGVIDEVVAEPLGGAHKDHAQAAEHLKTAIAAQIDKLAAIEPQELLQRRHEKYRVMGTCIED